MSVSVNDAEAKEALKFVEDFLIAQGFSRDPAQPATEGFGAKASYAKFTDTGLRQVGTMDVYLAPDRVEVVFIEFGNRTGHLKATQKTFDLLRQSLSDHYGSQRVKITKVVN